MNNNNINYKNDIANHYWDERFNIENIQHHQSQNISITKDFLNNMTNRIKNIINQSNNIIEIGCGTGELSYELSKICLSNIVGTDLSQKAINFANNNYSNDRLNFKVFDCINCDMNENFDIAICSNILEHFKNPYFIIDKILNFSQYVLILVPYNQPCADGYSCEGGAGHVFQFTEQSFDKYTIIDNYTFRTLGWQYSSAGEVPLQLCILIKK